MLTNIMWPVFEFFMFWSLRVLFRMLDQRRCCVKPTPESTRSKTLQAFESLYSGPNFLVHYKYSTMQNIVFVCFLFGPVMPLLFPVGLVSLFVLNTMERLMLAYSYKKPLMQDSLIAKSSIKTMRIAPFLYNLTALAAFSNQQVFNNHVVVNDGTKIYPLADHTFYQIFKQLNPATPLVFLFFTQIILMILESPFQKIGDRIHNKEKINIIVENLPNYFHSLKNKVRRRWLAEEIIASERLGMSSTTTVEKLDGEECASMKGKPKLQGVPNYDILANPVYRRKFAYVDCSISARVEYCISQYNAKTDRKKVLFSADMVRLVCDLAYLPRWKAKSLEFNADYFEETFNFVEKKVVDQPLDS